MAVVALAVFCIVAAGAPMRASAGARTTGDEPHYLLTAISLAEDHDLDVSDERAEVRYLPFSELPPLIQAEIRPDGTQVSPHDPLLPLLLAVPMWVGGWLVAKLALAAAAAAVAAVTFAVAVRRFGVSSRVAAWTAGIAGASPPLAVYGTQVYPEIVGALCVIVGVWAVTGPRTVRSSAVAALCVTALPWLSVKYAPVAAVLAVAAVVPLLRSSARRAIALCAVLALGGVVFLVAHRAWYGGWTPYAAGSHFADGELTVMGNPDYLGRAQRITGLLVDRHFGLVPWQPAALLIPAAVVSWLGRAGRGRWLLPAILGTGWATATFVALTMHGWWWPGRQVVVVLPAAVLMVAGWVDRLEAPHRRWAAALGALGVLAQVLLEVGVLSGRHTLIVDFDRTIDPVVHWLGPLLPDLRRPGATTAVLHLVWVGALAASCWWSVRGVRGRLGGVGDRVEHDVGDVLVP
jgi:hypothetical protein